MEGIPYTLVIRSLMYVQASIKLDINFVVGMLGMHQSNLGLDHCKTMKKVLRYLQGKNDYMFTYKKFNYLEMFGYIDSDFTTYGYKKNPHYDICSFKLEDKSSKRMWNSLLLLHLLWKMNFWNALKSQFKWIGYKNLF